MTVPWSLLVVLTVAIGLLVIRRAGPRGFRGTRPVRGALWCPAHARDMGVDMRVAAWDGRPVEIERCSAFGPDGAVSCEKACLELDRSTPAGRSRHRCWCA